MPLFLITFFALYGGMHFYVFRKIDIAFRLSPERSNILVFWMFFTTISPLLVRFTEHSGYEYAALAAAWPSFTWMGFIFILASIFVIIDLLRLILSCLTRFRKYHDIPLPGSRIICEAAILLAIAATLYGFYEARTIKTEHLTITSPHLDAAAGKIRVVQLSDVHLGLLIGENRLNEILRIVEQAKPDVIVSTGDFIDGKLSKQAMNQYDAMSTMLSKAEAPLGKFAIMGNHEYHAGIDNSLEMMKRSGFRVLRNESQLLTGGMIISGVDDKAWKHLKVAAPKLSENDLLKSLPKDKFRLHLKHRPLIAKDDDGLFDLQLSGHTHKGQIITFYPLTWFQFPIPTGTSKTGKGSQIHVNRGTGTWGPTIRLFAPPEVTIIDIVPLSLFGTAQNKSVKN